jgi:hypothetical protein
MSQSPRKTSKVSAGFNVMDNSAAKKAQYFKDSDTPIPSFLLAKKVPREVTENANRINSDKKFAR